MNTSASVRRLVRRPSDGRIAGVCAGIAEYFDADVTLIRLLWIVFSIVPGGVIGGLVAYIAVWLVMPEGIGAADIDPNRKRLSRSVSDRKLGAVCGGLAEYLNLDSTLVRVAWVVLTIVPGAILFGAIAYLVAWFIMPLGQTAAHSGSSIATPSEPSVA